MPKKDPNFHKGSFGKVPSTAGKGVSCPKPIRTKNSYGSRPAVKRGK